MIRNVRIEDSDAIAAIYNHYVVNSTVTFEVEAITGTEIAKRIQANLDADLPWLIAEAEGNVIGYCYATSWKARKAYQHSVEISVYLAADSHTKGIGTQLYAALFTQLKTQNIHAVMAGIALPNEASIALHEKHKMQKVAHFKQVGKKFGQWIDVAYWQVIL
ncbi:GNAT family N-acetyltransferase [Pseudoalteromonas sp. Hal040]|uniref:arsinothricin resistance N-acetyltransferase ArsN1 family B n=1 Tax=unclassified Pseudoalteromonas TaxID=194690 RepID=UPI00301DF230